MNVGDKTKTHFPDGGRIPSPNFSAISIPRGMVFADGQPLQAATTSRWTFCSIPPAPDNIACGNANFGLNYER